ncbi:hypothetical protein CHCC15087_3074 [Bacillus licheniformis]|nr:hypothetical protein CHCC15291_2085 [Bacillus licheniformis]TWL97990.1 hypothetical protein CHCC15289_2806 [Bacillus licheniformis]TWM20965.1 hypothetical protein CHCC15087_3074 [Bacillus licheniformis]TWN05061.1 hypothetical protein CHCC14596_2997 [Bacillus licheniformis]
MNEAVKVKNIRPAFFRKTEKLRLVLRIFTFLLSNIHPMSLCSCKAKCRNGLPVCLKL